MRTGIWFAFLVALPALGQRPGSDAGLPGLMERRTASLRLLELPGLSGKPRPRQPEPEVPKLVRRMTVSVNQQPCALALVTTGGQGPGAAKSAMPVTRPAGAALRGDIIAGMPVCVGQ